ncbi:hypothetical protein [Litchfieldella rifensis]|uniref:Uncharacterized protein n=1 Tax=Litchfieldella rifensis TaxID=762643 RepID=A0ABV7LSU4_9GAMM
MFKWLKPTSPPRVWVVKQIDHDLLHLCGQGIAESKERHKDTLTALEEGRYHGPIRLANSGVVLNAALFEALAPIDSLRLGDDDQAHWRGKNYRVSWVPQRCWAFTGRLITQTVMINGRPSLASTEDVSGIRAKANPSTQENDLDSPLFVPLEARDDPRHEKTTSSRREAGDSPGGQGREWRNKDHD